MRKRQYEKAVICFSRAATLQPEQVLDTTQTLTVWSNLCVSTGDDGKK